MKIMKFLKIAGVVLILIAMAYMTRWENSTSSCEALAEVMHYVEVDGVKYYGRYVDGIWREPAELYPEAIILENSDDE